MISPHEWGFRGRLKRKLNDANQLHIKGASAKCSFYFSRSTLKKEEKNVCFLCVARTLEGGYTNSPPMCKWKVKNTLKYQVILDF